MVSIDPPSFQWSSGHCNERASELAAHCSFESATRDAGCVVSSVAFPTACLQPRRRNVKVGEVFGLGPCEDPDQHRYFTFTGQHSLLQVASWGKLCLARSADLNALEVLSCSSLTPSHSHFVSLVDKTHQDVFFIGFKQRLKAQTDVSPRCQDEFLRQAVMADAYRKRPLSSFQPLHNNCPNKKKKKKKEKEKKTPSRGVVYQYKMHVSPDHVLSMAEGLMDQRYGLRSFFVFHVDASSSAEVHSKVRAFCAMHSNVSRMVEPPVDVEWGSPSEAAAQIAAMKVAYETWPRMWDNIVLLTGFDMPVATYAATRSFWNRNAGLNGFFKVHEYTPVVALTELVSTCERVTVSFGSRPDPLDHIQAQGGRLMQAQMYLFLGYNFVEYMLTSSVTNLEAVSDLLTYTFMANEAYFPTLFFNSPFCGDLADVPEEEYMFTAWPGKRGDVEGPYWFKPRFTVIPDVLQGSSPFWLRNSDAPRIAMYPDLQWIRKVDPEHCPELIKSAQAWIRNDTDRSFFATTGFGFRLAVRGRCLTMVSAAPPSFMLSKDGCGEDASLLQARCDCLRSDGSVTQQRPSSLAGLADSGSLCTISPVMFPTICLQANLNSYLEVGSRFGLGPCERFMEKSVFRFIKQGLAIQIAGMQAESHYGSGDNNAGLCLVGSHDGKMLEATQCQAAVQTDLYFMSILDSRGKQRSEL
eukprot:TRINITY_DN11667_c1_g3_i1.p1 TRINITY_DN11667_c1_g3~~TRINITY_DN11667_c1_g3_i1.p1  ORF type:complete len:761 (-),score=63.47 TRINITY_DN11667_c1_g3_i1:59-2140(-)